MCKVTMYVILGLLGGLKWTLRVKFENPFIARGESKSESPEFFETVFCSISSTVK